MERERKIYRVTLTGTLVNLLLTGAKFAAGVKGRSSAMVADAVHSASDLATDLVVLLFVRLASRPQDEGHDFGHGKYETLATLLVGGALLAVGIELLAGGVRTIVGFAHGIVPPRPGGIALAAALLSILSKEWLFRYTRRVARETESPSVEANAWHHRSDALSSVGTLAGIGCAYFADGAWRLADPAAAVAVAFVIAFVALRLMKTGLDELLERSLPPATERRILELVTADPAIESPHHLRTRRIGPAIAIEVHVRVDPDMTVADSHRLTVGIERRLRDEYGATTMVAIHVEPRKTGG